MSTENRIGLGAKLESGRKARGWSQQEAAKRTKLRADTIRRLENEEFDELPSLAYARGFIRIYARELGLDGHSLLKELDGSAEDDFDINDLRPEDLESIPHRIQPPQLTPQTVGLVLIALVILMAVTVGVMGLFRYGPEKSAEVARNISELVQPLEKATQEEIEEAQKKGGALKAEAVDSAPKALAADAAPKAEPVVLKAEAAAPKAEAAVAADEGVPVVGGVPVAVAVPATNQLQFYAGPGVPEEKRWVRVLGKRGTEDVTLYEGTIPSGQVFPGEGTATWNADVFIILMQETQGIDIIFNGQNYGKYNQPGSQRFLIPTR